MKALRFGLLLSAALAFASTISAATAKDLKYEGVKFWVYRVHTPDTVRLWRLQLTDGSHLYTSNKQEADRLVKSEKASIEPMEAFVLATPKEGATRLYRFERKASTGLLSQLYTTSLLEGKQAKDSPTFKLNAMRAFVYPQDFKPPSDREDQIVPMYCFYNPAGGDYLYTTSEVEKNTLTGAPANPTKPPSNPVKDKIADASQKLAVLATGKPATATDPITIRFTKSLESIQRSYPDLTPQRMAEIIYAGHLQLKKNGKSMPLEKIAELTAAAIPKNQSPKSKFTFNDVAASVVGCLIGEDYSANPEQAAIDARSMLEELNSKD